MDLRANMVSGSFYENRNVVFDTAAASTAQDGKRTPKETMQCLVTNSVQDP